MNNDIIKFVAENRDHLDLVIDLIPIPIFMKDREGRYIDCNTAFTRFLSVTREQLIGSTVHELWSKEEADVFRRQDEELFQSRGLQVYESRISSSDGKAYIVQFHKQVFTDHEGQVKGFLGAIFDITEKKLQLERLEAAHKRVGALEGLLPMCAWCKRMREEDSSWVQVEEYICTRT